jgi:hypothetical protein
MKLLSFFKKILDKYNDSTIIEKIFISEEELNKKTISELREFCFTLAMKKSKKNKKNTFFSFRTTNFDKKIVYTTNKYLIFQNFEAGIEIYGFPCTFKLYFDKNGQFLKIS